jgi:hypothetical protein
MRRTAFALALTLTAASSRTDVDRVKTAEKSAGGACNEQLSGDLTEARGASSRDPRLAPRVLNAARKALQRCAGKNASVTGTALSIGAALGRDACGELPFFVQMASKYPGDAAVEVQNTDEECRRYKVKGGVPALEAKLRSMKCQDRNPMNIEKEIAYAQEMKEPLAREHYLQDIVTVCSKIADASVDSGPKAGATGLDAMSTADLEKTYLEKGMGTPEDRKSQLAALQGIKAQSPALYRQQLVTFIGLGGLDFGR